MGQHVTEWAQCVALGAMDWAVLKRNDMYIHHSGLCTCVLDAVEHRGTPCTANDCDVMHRKHDARHGMKWTCMYGHELGRQMLVAGCDGCGGW